VSKKKKQMTNLFGLFYESFWGELNNEEELILQNHYMGQKRPGERGGRGWECIGVIHHKGGGLKT